MRPVRPEEVTILSAVSRDAQLLFGWDDVEPRADDVAVDCVCIDVVVLVVASDVL